MPRRPPAVTLTTLFVIGCGRIDFGPIPLDEPVTVAPGWTVSLFHDLSGDYTYIPMDWVDGTETYDNAPNDIFVLSGAFGAGLAIVAGRSLFELPADGGFVLHDYRPPAINTTGPDGLSRGVQVEHRGVSSILAASTSSDGGDGVYQVATDWTIANLVGDNNTRTVVWDPTGAFDGQGVDTVYVGTDHGMLRFDPTLSSLTALITGDVFSGAVVASGKLLIVDSGDCCPLVQIEPTSHTRTPVGPRYDMLWLAGTPPASPPTTVVAVLDSRGVVDIDETSAFTQIAGTGALQWRWVAAVEVPSDHPLGVPGGRAIYVLESNRALDADRVFRLTHP